MTYPTPGKANEEEYIERQILEMPTFSKPSGLYNEEFDLEIKSKYGYKVYYSVDCSTPTIESTLYTSPVHIYDKSPEDNIISSRTDVSGTKTLYAPKSPVNKCMVIRAICYDDNGNYSAVASASYWINQDGFLEEGIPVMSISTDFENLFGYEKGIYCNGKVFDDWVNSDEYNPNLAYNFQPANYRQRGFEWERLGNVSYVDEKGKDVCEQMVGLRIKGNSSRGISKKSFNMYSRYTYDGNNTFTYKFNGKKCEQLIVRTGGNNNSFIPLDDMNAMVAKANNLDFETQDSTTTYLFLNGEFWGVYYLRDNYDSRYIEEKYDIEDSIIFKTGQVDEGYQTDIRSVQLARRSLTLDMTIPSNYEEFNSRIEINSFLDYMLFELYIDTKDFNIFSDNCGNWMSRHINNNIDKSDGRMRFMFFDSDIACGINYAYTVDHNPFSKEFCYNTFAQLMKNEDFYDKIIKRAKEMCEMLSSDETISIIENYYLKHEKLISQNNVRFNGREDSGQTRQYDILLDWYKNRPQYFVSFFENFN